MEKKLDRVREIDLREVFKDEARDLTPWLALDENLELLSSEIGIEISLIQVEANVGNYNVDILAEEAGTGRKIIIENQLESSNHDHLGKLITYASGHDATVIVWIFRDIREEHRQAIDWLNEHTDENISFYAIKLNIWRIGDSLPAPKFEIICNPNEWQKAIKSSSSKPEVTEGKLKQLEFWTTMNDYIKENKAVNFPFRKPQPQNWMDVKLGSSLAHVSISINTRDKRLWTGVYINDDKELFKYLYSIKDKIEKELNLTLYWDNSPRKASIIGISRNDFDIDDGGRYAEYYEWIYTHTMLFRKIFSKHIKDYSTGK